MLIERRRGWELPERAATPERLFHERRRLVNRGVGVYRVRTKRQQEASRREHSPSARRWRLMQRPYSPRALTSQVVG